MHTDLLGLTCMISSTFVCVECCSALRRKDMGSLEGLGSPEINGIAKTGRQSLREGYVTESM